MAASPATPPPMTASSQRVKAWSGAATRVVMIADCTPAWMVMRSPAPTSEATPMATTTTASSWSTPLPNTWTNRSPMSTPTATPIITSAARRRRWP